MANDAQQQRKDLLAKWAWATIASGVDVGFTAEQMAKALTKNNIIKIAEIAREGKPT